MKETIVRDYVGRHIKLVHDGYATKGTIRKLSDGAIIFDSDNGTESAMSVELIQAIILLQ